MPSQVVRWFSYEATTKCLTVVFQTGRRYRYRDVPQNVATEFKAARSKGEYFNEHIRDRYSFERLDVSSGENE